MSTVTPLADIFELPADAPVLAVKGTVKNIFKRHTGQGQYGEWSLQDIILTDGKVEVKTQLDGREPFDNSLKGREIYLVAHKGEKGFTGLKAKDKTNKKSGQTERILSVTKTAEITAGAPNAPAANTKATGVKTGGGNSANPEASVPDAGGLGETRGVDHAATAKDGVRQAKSRLGAHMNLLSLCMEGVCHCFTTFHRKHQDEPFAREVLTPALFQASTMAMFIALRDQGTPDLLPGKPLDMVTEKQQPTTANNEQNEQAHN